MVELRARLGEHDAPATSPTATSSAPSTLSRRKALARLGGVAAAAGVAATAATLTTKVPTAKAAANTDGNPLIIGAANGSTFETDLIDDGTANSFATFLASNDSFFINGALSAVTGLGAFGGVGVNGIGFDDVNNGIGGVGVEGSDPEGVGVIGSSTDGIGMFGLSSTGIGTLSGADTGIALYLFGTSRFLQEPTIGHPGPPNSGDGFFQIYEQIRDSNGVLWLSVFDPNGGLRWVRPGMVNGAAAGGAMNFLPSPVRIIGAGTPPGKPLGKGTHTDFTLAGGHGIPADATGVFGNATVLTAPTSGWVAFTPKGGVRTTNSLNFTGSDQPLSNFVAVGLAGGAITVTVSDNCNVRLIYDVVGYCL